MNEHVELERTVARHIASEGVSPPSDAFYDDLLISARRSGQRPEWLALIRERPMRTDSKLAVGSPMARVAAILAATFLLALTLAAAGVAGRQLLAADGAIVVDQSGGGDVRTVGEAVAIAGDDDTIIIRPGTYTESVVVSEAITIRGEGDRDAIVIEHGQDADTVEVDLRGDRMDLPYSLLLDRSEATVTGVSLVSDDGVALMVAGGSPLIDDVRIQGGFGSGKHGMLISDASEAVVRGIAHGGWLTVQGRSTPVVEDSDLSGTCLQIWQEGTAGTYRRNTISRCPFSGWAIDISGSAPLLEGNTIGRGGIDVYGLGDTHPVIRDNVFEDNRGRAIDVAGDATATIEGNRFIGAEPALGISSRSATIRDNRFSDNATAISLTGSVALVEGNSITGGGAGIVVTRGSPSLVDNTIEGASGRGISVGGGATPTLVGNRSCDNGENLHVSDSIEPVIDDTNEIC